MKNKLFTLLILGMTGSNFFAVENVMAQVKAVTPKKATSACDVLQLADGTFDYTLNSIPKAAPFPTMIFNCKEHTATSEATGTQGLTFFGDGAGGCLVNFVDPTDPSAVAQTFTVSTKAGTIILKNKKAPSEISDDLVITLFNYIKRD